jgi:signal transduction histidine kinase
VISALARLPHAPEVAEPPGRGWPDWALAAGVAVTAAVETVVRDDLPLRPLALVVGVALALTLLWRRTHPLAAVAIGFGALAVADLTSLVITGDPLFVYAGASVLVLVFALFRWGTGRQPLIGGGIVLAEWVLVTSTDFSGIADAVGGLFVLLFVAALGVAARYRQIVRAQQFDRVRSHEREVLARDLHDTVAHHVSAIAVQAQAGQVLARAEDLGGATQALRVIEAEASRTLTEMRAIVGSLRRDGERVPEFAQRGVRDLGDLASAEGQHGLRIAVEQTGPLDDLRPSVQAALYRVTQEAITNAKRHARHASRVDVAVAVDPDGVRLSVTDDGERVATGPRPPGYGLVGMAERMSLLGGTLEAGPGPEGGWTVLAIIPLKGGAV